MGKGLTWANGRGSSKGVCTNWDGLSSKWCALSRRCDCCLVSWGLPSRVDGRLTLLERDCGWRLVLCWRNDLWSRSHLQRSLDWADRLRRWLGRRKKVITDTIDRCDASEDLIVVVLFCKTMVLLSLLLSGQVRCPLATDQRTRGAYSLSFRLMELFAFEMNVLKRKETLHLTRRMLPITISPYIRFLEPYSPHGHNQQGEILHLRSNGREG